MNRLISDMAPPTNREEYELAAVHANMLPSELAASLPQDAIVADIGAGGSRFGFAIAKMRPDITWHNIDPCYGDDRRLKVSPRDDMPPNLRYSSGDIVRDTDFSPLEPGSVDRVYCSALMPHLILASPDIGRTAIGNMGQLVKPDGIVSVSGFTPYGRAVPFTGEAYRDRPDEVADIVIEHMTLTRGIAFFQRINNVGSWILGRPFAIQDFIPTQPY